MDPSHEPPQQLQQPPPQQLQPYQHSSPPPPQQHFYPQDPPTGLHVHESPAYPPQPQQQQRQHQQPPHMNDAPYTAGLPMVSHAIYPASQSLEPYQLYLVPSFASSSNASSSLEQSFPVPQPQPHPQHSHNPYQELLRDAFPHSNNDTTDWVLARLREQVEFYFGWHNLLRDDFMIQQLCHHQGAVPCHVVGRFPRIQDILQGRVAPSPLLEQALLHSAVVRVDGPWLVPCSDAWIQAWYLRFAPPAISCGVDARHSPLTTVTTSSTTDETLGSSSLAPPLSLTTVPHPAVPHEQEAEPDPQEPTATTLENPPRATTEHTPQDTQDQGFEPLPAVLLTGESPTRRPQWLPPEFLEQAPQEPPIMYYQDEVPYGYTVTATTTVMPADPPAQEEQNQEASESHAPTKKKKKHPKKKKKPAAGQEPAKPNTNAPKNGMDPPAKSAHHSNSSNSNTNNNNTNNNNTNNNNTNNSNTNNSNNNSSNKKSGQELAKNKKSGQPQAKSKNRSNSNQLPDQNVKNSSSGHKSTRNIWKRDKPLTKAAGAATTATSGPNLSQATQTPKQKHNNSSHNKGTKGKKPGRHFNHDKAIASELQGLSLREPTNSTTS